MEGWNNLDITPPDELLEVIDAKGNICKAHPSFYPYQKVPAMKYPEGSARIDAINPYWDGGWIIQSGVERDKLRFEQVVQWRKIKKD